MRTKIEWCGCVRVNNAVMRTLCRCQRDKRMNKVGLEGETDDGGRRQVEVWLDTQSTGRWSCSFGSRARGESEGKVSARGNPPCPPILNWGTPELELGCPALTHSAAYAKFGAV
jgi:hypothetical protein